MSSAILFSIILGAQLARILIKREAMFTDISVATMALIGIVAFG